MFFEVGIQLLKNVWFQHLRCWNQATDDPANRYTVAVGSCKSHTTGKLRTRWPWASVFSHRNVPLWKPSGHSYGKIIAAFVVVPYPFPNILGYGLVPSIFKRDLQLQMVPGLGLPRASEWKNCLPDHAVSIYQGHAVLNNTQIKKCSNQNQNC